MGIAETHEELASGRKRGFAAATQRAGLSLLSLPYGLAVRLRNLLFDTGWKRTHAAGVPVVSVGNLTLGGTGKTPAVEYVARFYRERGVQVAVLSRGYGGTGGSNDEALVLEENLPDVPHLVGADRVASARIAVEELESELLVLDDGFQHRRLRRDLDIVLLDATQPWGYGRMFPRGRLREPRRGLRRADVVLLTRCDQAPPAAAAQLKNEVAALAPGKPVIESVHAPQCLMDGGSNEYPLEEAQGRKVAAFCGLGHPAAFFRTIEGLGAELTARRTFPDHHAYTRADVDDLRQWAKTLAADMVLTTQKDMVKLRLNDLGPLPLRSVRIALRPTVGKEELDRRLDGVLAIGSPRPTG